MNIDSSSHQKKTQKNVLKQQKTTGQKRHFTFLITFLLVIAIFAFSSCLIKKISDILNSSMHCGILLSDPCSALLCVQMTLPPWPMYRRSPLRWQPARDFDSASEESTSLLRQNSPSIGGKGKKKK